ncbi:MAG TPA: hypothetical protein VFY06_07745 [Verrucomicrobiae bacterium]|nr:hypothetical protein [Verrucomicrobiae bacterium]
MQMITVISTEPENHPVPVRIRVLSALPDRQTRSTQMVRPVQIELPDASLEAAIRLPAIEPAGMAIFAHARAGEHLKPHFCELAKCLAARNIGVLQVELQTGREQAGQDSDDTGQDQRQRLTERLVAVAEWIHQRPRFENLPLGIVGFGAGGTAALMAAAALAAAIDAVIAIDGQPDMVGDRLANILAATLLVVKDDNHFHLRMNEIGFVRLRCDKDLQITPGNPAGAGSAGHDILDRINDLTAGWLQRHLRTRKNLAPPVPEPSGRRKHAFVPPAGNSRPLEELAVT